MWKLLRRKQCRCVAGSGKAIRVAGVGNDEMAWYEASRDGLAGQRDWVSAVLPANWGLVSV